MVVLYRRVYLPKIGYFCPPPLFYKWYFSLRYSENFPFSPFFFPLLPYICVFPHFIIFFPKTTNTSYFQHEKYTPLVLDLMINFCRRWVDENMNCEDIAFNFMVANSTGLPPVKIGPRLVKIRVKDWLKSFFQPFFLFFFFLFIFMLDIST